MTLEEVNRLDFNKLTVGEVEDIYQQDGFYAICEDGKISRFTNCFNELMIAAERMWANENEESQSGQAEA